jgi:hypothetical protein
MCPILMIVSVPEQEIPDDFSRLLLKKTTLLLKKTTLLLKKTTLLLKKRLFPFSPH